MAIFDILYCAASVEKLKEQYAKKLVMFRKTDLRDKLEVERSFIEIKRIFGHIDIVVNSAGIIDEQNFQNTIDVNLVCIIK